MHWDLVAASSLFSLSLLWPIVQTIIGIGLIIFVHELGHFLAAKSCGVKCEKFYVGFDAFDINLGVLKIPRKLLHFTWGETEYGIGILPLGGYVKMLGQHDNPAEADQERERSTDSESGRLDPRSYMAKTVPQRMLIISAGVIMNLIFGIIFATMAFSFGVSYQPPTIGGTYSGSPAWQKNLSGAEVIEVNGIKTGDRYYPFNSLAEAVVMGGEDVEVDLEIRRPGTESQTEKLSVTPVSGLINQRGMDFPMLGIAPMQSSRLRLNDFVIEHAPAFDSTFESGDLITKVNGASVNNLVDLKKELSKIWDQDATFTVLRGVEEKVFTYRQYQDKGASTGKEFDVVVKPNPMFIDGLSMAYGEIVSVQEGSPAHQEGIKPKDKILSVNDKPFNPMLLSQDLRQMARDGQTAKLTVRRFEGEQENILTFNLVPQFLTGVSSEDVGLPFAVDEIGIAFRVLSEVADVAPEGPAAKSGIAKGDVFVKATIEYSDTQIREKYLAENKKIFEISGDDLANSWPIVNQQMQAAWPSAVLKLVIKRGGKEMPPVEIALVKSEKYFNIIRGIGLEPLQEVYISPTLADAAKCGLYQVSYDSQKILKLLKQLFVGKVPVTALGGIGTIAIVSTSEATSGTTRLLLFLTLLSVNLAILNFLPIPVLDGGHMVFLAYEGVTGRPPNEKVQEGLTMIGALMLLTLMVFAFGMDIWRFSSFFQ